MTIFLTPINFMALNQSTTTGKSLPRTSSPAPHAIGRISVGASLFVWLLTAATVGTAPADEWPMWRYDAMRRAASQEILPREDGELRLLWRRDFEVREQAWDDPLNHDLMTYDRVLEPIVAQGRLCVGLNNRDQLACFDLSTGEALWAHFAEGPVRLPPAAANGRVYFASDDGFLYCVDLRDGSRVWRFQGAPNSLHAIGNRRLTSAWPARGGPVVRDNTVYFAASIWPFMGTFLYALEASDNSQPKVQWVNDSTGAQFTKQPHSAPSFAGVAPQGALVATSKDLIVPGGRSVPAVFDRSSGELRYFEINAGGKGNGGSFVAATEEHFYVHTRLKGTRAFHLKDGVKTAFMPNEPVLVGDIAYSSGLADKGKTPVVRAATNVSSPQTLWEIPADASGDLIAAGQHLLAGGKKYITAIHLPQAGSSPIIDWKLPVDQPVERLLAADGKVIAVSAAGRISVYGRAPASSKPRSWNRRKPRALAIHTADRMRAKSLIRLGEREGYALCFGSANSEIVRAIAAESPFSQLAIVDADEQRVEELRSDLDAAHRYGEVTAHVSKFDEFMAPKYMAHQVFVMEPERLIAHPASLKTIYESVRPYGGVLCLVTSDKQQQRRLALSARRLDLEQALIKTTMQAVVIQRVGALPGSADWTHQHGDIGNTIKSNDRRVKLPLGILWFGGSSNMDVLPRHGHGPPEQVIGGRLFIQGINSLSARDVYTGRVLWKREFEDLGVYDVFYDATYKNTPLNPAYNQVHIPGANARGTNYVVTEDRVYLLEGDRCLVLDPRTGKTLTKIQLPQGDDGQRKEWGYVGIYKDVRIGGVGFANYRERH